MAVDRWARVYVSKIKGGMDEVRDEVGEVEEGAYFVGRSSYLQRL